MKLKQVQFDAPEGATPVEGHEGHRRNEPQLTNRRLHKLHSTNSALIRNNRTNYCSRTSDTFVPNILLYRLIYHVDYYVSVTIVLMVMLMLVLVLARMLIFRTLVKRSTVHNNGDGDVNVRNDVKRSRKCLVL
jgi:hypothetical protein